jgi:predicted ATPase
MASLGRFGRFVGRARSLEAIRTSFEQDHQRIVTIVGPPGMGKTRLALRYAEELTGVLKVLLCDLTESKNGSDLISHVARALRKPLLREGGEGAMEHAGNALAEAGPLLLILDNLETIAKDAAPIVEEWCGAIAPEALVLVTSRIKLGIVGERVIELPPLDLETDAIDLFLERAGGIGGGTSDLTGVRDLVRALDGIPLAIELAAARSKILGPAQLLARLQAQKKDVLATLRAAIDSSWELLSPAEKSVLKQCSIFHGEHFTFEAVEAIVSSTTRDGEPLLDVVTALHDKSLIRSDANARLSMYASIREFAAEKEAADPTANLAERHRSYFLELAGAAFARFAKRGDAQSRAALAAQKENLLAITAHQGGLDHALVVRYLEPIIAAEKTFEDLIAILDAGLASALGAGACGAGQARPPSNDAEQIAGHLLIARGNAYGLRAHFATALADLERAREIGRRAQDAALEAEALVMASVRYRHQGRFDDARTAGEEALRLLKDKDEPRVEGAGRAVLGLLFCELGLTEESRRENLRARSIFREAGDRWSEALALSNLGQLDQAAGQWETSAHAYDGALERFREHGDRRYESRYLGYRATLELERGDRSTARAMFGTALEMLQSLRIRHTEGLFRACKGALEALDGDVRLAMTELDRAADLLLAVEAPPPSIVAALEVHRGQLDVALAKTRDPSQREGLLESARGRLANARFASQSEDVRFAMRLLDRTLSDRPVDSKKIAPRAGLVVDREARWFMIGDAAASSSTAAAAAAAAAATSRVDLSRRHALRLLLRALVDRQRSAPDAALTSDDLLAIGWPGERVLATAGSTRVRVAISTLRRLGLAHLLITRDDGYLLDPKGIIRVEG